IGVGSPKNITFQVACDEAVPANGRSALLDAFPELRSMGAVSSPVNPISFSLRNEPGSAAAPFRAQVVKIEKVGQLYAVDLEATESPIKWGNSLKENCTVRAVGLSSVVVSQGAIVEKLQMIGRQDAPDSVEVRCKSARPVN